MKPTCGRAVVLAALALASCDNGASTASSGQQLLQIVNASRSGAVNVLVDGQLAATNVANGAAAAPVAVSAGSHTFEVRRVTTNVGFARTVTFGSHGTLTFVAIDSAGALSPVDLSDTNTIVPAGYTKLRVAHMAGAAPPIDIWRTQPDYMTPIRVQFPFNYLAVSPYLQSTPGAWRVMVSHPIVNVTDPMPDTLANSGSIAVADGKSRTVVVVDAPGGGVSVVVVEP